MPDAVFILGGILILSASLFDFLKTTIGMAGIGPISGRVAHLMWRGARAVLPWLHGRLHWSFEDVVGPGILCGIAGTWIVLNCAGYTLLYSAPGALLHSENGEPARAIESLAFAGASISTLGASIAEPGSGLWDVLSVVAAVNGMIVLTLSVSFIMNVWQTVRRARSLALRVAALGAVATELDDDGLAEELESLGSDFAALVVAIRATPVVGFFPTERTEMSLPLAVLAVCDMVRRVGDRRRDSAGLVSLRMALDALGQVAVDPDEEVEDGLEGARRWAESRRLIA